MSKEALFEALDVLKDRNATIKASKEKVDILSKCLNNSSITSFIDHQSEQQNDRLNWSSIVNILCDHLKHSIDHSAALKDPSRSLQPIIDLLKNTITKSDSKCPRLHGSVSHICSVVATLLNQLSHVSVLQTDCHHILSKILSIPAYWMSLKSTSHHNLIKIYVSLLSNYPTSTTSSLNARIFRYLLLGNFSDLNGSSIHDLSSYLSSFVKNYILPLTNFVKMADSTPLLSVIEAINHFMLHACSNASRVCIPPIMKNFNHLLIPSLSKSKPNDLRLAIIQFFRIQTALLVSADGSFDSASLETEEDEIEDFTDYFTTSRGEILGEQNIFALCVGLVEAANQSVDTSKPQKHKLSIEYQNYALFDLMILFFIKKTIQGNVGFQTLTSKSKFKTDPKAFLHEALFGNMDIRGPELLVRTLSGNITWNASPVVLSWIQLAVLLITKQPLWLGVRWSLKFISDTLTLLDKLKDAVLVESWLLRLLSALSISSSTILNSAKPQQTAFESTVEEERDEDLDKSQNDEDATQLFTEYYPPHASEEENDKLLNNQLRDSWKRVWSTVSLRMNHAPLTVVESGLELLTHIIEADLLPPSLIQSSQNQLWQQFTGFHSWQALPLVTSFMDKHQFDLPSTLIQSNLTGLATSNSSFKETRRKLFIQWINSALSAAYSSPNFKPDELLKPEEISKSLLKLVGISAMSSESSGDMGCSKLENIAQSHKNDGPATFLLSILDTHTFNQNFESEFMLTLDSRVILPSHNPFLKFTAVSQATNSNQTKSGTTSNMTTFSSISETEKRQLLTCAISILNERTTQLAAEGNSGILQTRGSLTIDVEKLVPILHKMTFHAGILIAFHSYLVSSSYLQATSNSTIPTLTGISPESQLESQIRDILVFVDSNIHHMEKNHLSLSAVLNDLTLILKTTRNSPIILLHFRSFLEFCTNFVSSELETRTMYIAKSRMATPKQSQEPQELTYSGNTKYRPPSRTTSESNFDQMEEDDFLLGKDGSQVEEETLGLLETQPTTLLFNSKLSSPSASNLGPQSKPTTALDLCFVSAIGFVSEMMSSSHSTNTRYFAMSVQSIISVLPELQKPRFISTCLQVLTELARLGDFLSDEHLTALQDSLEYCVLCQEILGSSYLFEQLMKAFHAISTQIRLKATNPDSRVDSSTPTATTNIGSKSFISTFTDLITGPLHHICYKASKINWNGRLMCIDTLKELIQIDPNNFSSDSSYDKLNGMLISLLSDPDFRVRKVMSETIKILFETFSSHLEIYCLLFDEHLKSLLEETEREEVISTALATLATICTCSYAAIPHILLVLHLNCIKHPIFRSLIPILVDHISLVTGYHDRIHFLSTYLPLVASKWDNFSLFPSFMYHNPKTQEFLCKFSSKIIQGILLPTYEKIETDPPKLTNFRGEAILSVAKLSSINIQQLLSENSVAFRSFILILKYSSQKELIARSAEISDFFDHHQIVAPSPTKGKSKKGASTRRKPMVMENPVEIIRFLIEQIKVDDHEQLPNSHQQTLRIMSKINHDNYEAAIRRNDIIGDHDSTQTSGLVSKEYKFGYEAFALCLMALAKEAQFDSISAFFASHNHHLLALINEFINDRFFSNEVLHDKLVSVSAVHLLALCNQPLTKPASMMIFRTLFRFLSNTNHNQVRFVVLNSILNLSQIVDADNILMNQDFITALTSVVFPLFELKNQDKLKDETAALLKELLVPRGAVSPALRLFGPFPKLHPTLIEINQAREADPGLVQSQWDFLTSIVPLGNNYTAPAKILAALNYLIDGLKSSKSELCEILISDTTAPKLVTSPSNPTDNISDSTKTTVKTALFECLWTLLHMASSPSESVQLKVAEALGEIGVFDLHSLGDNFHPFAIKSPSSPPIPIYDGYFTKYTPPAKKSSDLDDIYLRHSQQTSNSIVYSQGKTKIIELVNELQWSQSWKIAKCAIETQRNLLQLEEVSQLVSNQPDNSPISSDFILCWSGPHNCQAPVVNLTDLENDVTTIDNDVEIGWSPIGKSFSSWITSLTSSLCASMNDAFLENLAQICKEDAKIAEMIFPLLLHSLFYGGVATPHIVSEFQAFVITSSEDASLVASHKKSFRLVLDSIIALRSSSLLRQRNDAEAANTHPTLMITPPSFWQNETPLYLAMIAKYVSYPSTALLFLEEWCENQNQGDLKWPNENSAIASEKNKALQVRTLALDIFAELDDSDCIYSLNQFNSLQKDPMALGKTYWQERNWDGTMRLFEVMIQRDPHQSLNSRSISSSNDSSHLNMLLSLQNNGYHHLLQYYVQGLEASMPGKFSYLSEFQYQAAWRICDWNALSTTINNHQSSKGYSNRTNNFEFHKAAFECLRDLFRNESLNSRRAIDEARLGLLKSELRFISSENTKNILPNLAKLQFFADIQHVLEAKESRKATSQIHLNASYDNSRIVGNSLPVRMIFDYWDKSMSVIEQHCSERFELVEPLLSLRGILLPLLVDSQTKNEYETRYWIKVLHTARKSKCFQMANLALEKARLPLGLLLNQDDVNSDPRTTQHLKDKMMMEYSIEECKFQWGQQKFSEAVSLSKELVRKLNAKTESMDLASVLKLAGKWLAVTKLEGPDVILNKYLLRASEIYRQLKSHDFHRCNAHFSVARFADSQYQSALERSKTPEFRESMLLRQKIRNELADARDAKSTRSLTNLYKQELSSVSTSEEYELRLKELMITALNNYFNSILKGTKHDTTATFRLVSLWFSHSSHPKVASTIKLNIKKVPSYKFLPLFYQIASRISTQTNDFQTALHELIVKVASDHPHHACYQIIALSNGGKHDPKKLPPNDKTLAAKKIIDRLKQINPIVIDQIIALSDAYDELAMYPFAKNQTGTVQIQGMLISKFNYPVPVPTHSSNPRDKDSNVFIHRFSSFCRFVGGVNLPRLIDCIGSDGKTYMQLVKGNDDMRQDAVMQQLFHNINNVLSIDKETSKRRLRVRTYNVIPLSPKTGVLEWVDKTQPLGDYLIGKSNAHAKYRPKDWLHTKCRTEMSTVANTDEHTKLETYRKIQEHFGPVLHHFFVENFMDPAQWFERRLAYTRSVAAGSIVGYIVGLGDRHSQNILLDKNLGEIIHIDLGIAFEQGKALAVPEQVPFRLTRDVVDGMGIMGVHGDFTRCCEHVVRVLREKHDNLVTIVEVFLHDPLARWISSTNVVAATEEPEQKNTKATSTLIRFRQKLQGQEEGITLSVEGQVQHLISEAQDERKLSQMFPGWGAWL